MPIYGHTLIPFARYLGMRISLCNIEDIVVQSHLGQFAPNGMAENSVRYSIERMRSLPEVGVGHPEY